MSLSFNNMLELEYNKYIAKMKTAGKLSEIEVKKITKNPFHKEGNRGASDLFRGLSDDVYGGAYEHDEYKK